VFDSAEQLRGFVDRAGQDRGGRLRNDRVGRDLARTAGLLGASIRAERHRRRLSLRTVALASGLGLGTVQAAESGSVCSVATYVRLADALGLRAEFDLVDPRRREPAPKRTVDPVHAAMGEAEASHLRALGFQVGLDEPFQHYQFAGRADVVAWSTDRRSLLHVENKTRFPDLQDSFGRFNAKRRYLGLEMAAVAGVGRWRSETHVLAALWSGEALHSIRLHRASFESVCPDGIEAFEGWWYGEPPAIGNRAVLIAFDPARGGHRDRRCWRSSGDLVSIRPRYRDYSDAVERLDLGRR